MRVATGRYIQSKVAKSWFWQNEAKFFNFFNEGTSHSSSFARARFVEVRTTPDGYVRATGEAQLGA
jgi:hypothetical protein